MSAIELKFRNGFVAKDRAWPKGQLCRFSPEDVKRYEFPSKTAIYVQGEGWRKLTPERLEAAIEAAEDQAFRSAVEDEDENEPNYDEDEDE